MTQTLALSGELLVSESNRRILCCYMNVTSGIQIIRITNIPLCHLERVVFPGQRLMFEALPEAELEIQSSEIASRHIPCQQLGVTNILTEE